MRGAGGACTVGASGPSSSSAEEVAAVALLFVRELTAEGDLILAFADDGSPVWALDRDTGLQWWFTDDDRTQARRAIDEAWPGFGSMPITAASYAGPHPTWELRRRETGRPAPPPPAADEHPVLPVLRDLRARFLRLSHPGRLLVGSAAAVAALVLVSWLLSTFAAAPRPSIAEQPAPPAAGAACAVRGELADAADGSLLVCAPTSRALSYELIWRATG
jgi:hypothetical protein